MQNPEYFKDFRSTAFVTNLSKLLPLSIVLVAFLFQIPALAEPVKGPLSLNCTSALPTTTFNLRTEGETLILKTIHHNGTPFMPIHEGVVVPHDFDYLADKAKVLTLMGSMNEFRFPLAKCQFYGPGLISCSGGERKNFNGTDIEALMFYTSKTKEETLGMSLSGIKFTLSVHSSTFAPVMEIPMNYTENECQMNF